MPRKKQKRIPFFGGEKCYACDEVPIGYRDRRPEGGDMEIACERHADPKIRVYEACIYCNGPIRKGSWVLDTGVFVHQVCQREQMKN